VDRGPMALFGAIVAIGLGPAMWLGAQFGAATESADRPPAVTVQQNGTPSGGSGAGDAPTDTITDQPVTNNQQPRSTRTARTKATTPTASPSESEGSPTPPVRTSSPSPSKSSGVPPTETTTPPDDPPTKDEPDVPPSPPTDVSTNAANVEVERA
jgi:hypothetical protein